MGIVYLAEDTTLGREVALKSIRGALAEDETLLLRFEAEARAVGKLFHPHIVPINALTREADVLYIEMPYLPGGSLAALMERRNLNCPEVVLYCAEVLDALAVCHEKGIVHRDVKPSNILLDSQGRALLGDFGLAKVVGDEMSSAGGARTASSVFVGTPRYAPLEAWEESAPTPAWDLYSIGVILFEGLAGRPVYETHSLLGHMRALEHAPAPALSQMCPDISAPLSNLVSALLENSPRQRLSDARVARDRLIRTPEFLRMESLSSDATTMTQKPPRRYLKKLHTRTATRNLVRTTFAVVGILSVLGLLLYSEWPFSTGTAAVPRPSQASAVSLPDYTEESILQTYRFSASQDPRVFVEISPAEEPLPGGEWLIVSQRGGAGQQVFGRTNKRLVLLTLGPSHDGGLEIVGTWGEYLDGFMQEAANGEVAGQGRWLDDSNILYCSLEYTSVRQGLRWQEEETLQLTAKTDTRFLWEIEESHVLQRLLFEELLTRDRKWMQLIPQWLPALKSNFVTAHRLDGDVLPPTPDADPNAWPPISNEAAIVPGWSRDESPSMRVAYSSEGLYFLLELPAPVVGAEVEVLLRRLLPASPAPFSDLHVLFLDNGECRIAGAEAGKQPAGSMGKSVQFVSGSNWNCKMFIPFERAGGTIDPENTQYYKVNINVKDHTADGSPLIRAKWGAPDAADLPHGVLICLPTTTAVGSAG